MAIEIAPLTAPTLSPATQPDAKQPAQRFVQALLFENFLKSAGMREALVPASLEGGMFGDFLIQQLAQDLAQQLGAPAAGLPYGK